MSVTCVIQARTGSTRLPGKVLQPVAGRPMLAYMLERLADLSVDALVVATSDLPQDDPIESLARAADVQVVRGSETDVLSRYLVALDAAPADTVIRLTSDCPLMDPRLVEAVLARHHAANAQYTTNTLPRTFPKGLDVEVMTGSALYAAAHEARDPDERQHVTPFLYRHPERFALANLRNPEPLGREWWTVDTAEDLAFIREVVEQLDDVHASWQTILEVVGRRATVAPGAFALRPVVDADTSLLFAWRNDPDAVRWSATQHIVSSEEHAAWFARVVDDPAHRIWVAERDGVALGMVRLDVRDAIGVVSIAVDPGHRGVGVGTELLLALNRELALDFQATTLRALIHPDHTASQRIFARAGYVWTGVDEPTGFAIYERSVR
ncbi:MAG: GNAT family N-acetyltransferase [Acidimicrobiia bacterium]